MKPKIGSDGDKVLFTDLEKRFLLNNDVCRVATVSMDNIPHVVPVCYVFLDNLFLFATDYNTKKYRNLKNNKNVGVVVDVYNPPDNQALSISGTAEIIERGEGFKREYIRFFMRNLNG